MSLDLNGRRTAAWNLLSLVAFAGVASHFVACGTNETVDGTSGPTAAVTNGTGYSPQCEGGMRDGFCDALSAQPESCACLDCAQTAYCKSMCKNDGTCTPASGEDCTCIDCVGQNIGNMNCQLGGNGNGPAGPGPTASASTSGTTTNTAAASTAASTAAATTAASTAASTSTGM